MEGPQGRPERPLTLPLASKTISIAPGEEETLFDRPFDDIEDYLSLHRFAWLPVAGDDVDPVWVGALWKGWRTAHGVPGSGWSWHPYTASERLVNILDYAKQRGLPHPMNDTLSILGIHGPAIFEQLEYFGEHNTGNHLANNGRGLYLGGLALGIDDWVDVGGKILTEEAKRIFEPSGILREGSSHYHLLLTRSYAECWLAAKAGARTEAAALEAITQKALSVIPALSLPGRFSLIGDISPDCPPQHFSGLIDPADTTGWNGRLSPEHRQSLRTLICGAPAGNTELDGWLRADAHGWSGLWHSAPKGWPLMPGHGHQDCGSFELHYDGEAVFIDPGRGAYGETGAAAHYRAAEVHNTLLVDKADPYPVNRPYYDDAFRSVVGGADPILQRQGDAIHFCHSGYARLRGVGNVFRTSTMTPNGLDIDDRVEGKGRHWILRSLVTPLAVAAEGRDVILTGKKHIFRVSGDIAATIAPLTVWQAYGQGRQGTQINFGTLAPLDWQGWIKVAVD
jgi:hypothetical protein